MIRSLAFMALLSAWPAQGAGQSLTMEECIESRARDFEPMMDNMADLAIVLVDYCAEVTGHQGDIEGNQLRQQYHPLANRRVLEARWRRQGRRTD
jgi:hypothetical protein